MEVDRELVLRIGRLAHIELTDAEVELFAMQLRQILHYMEKLHKITEPAEPFVFGDLPELPLREDILGPSISVEDGMRNAPDRKNNLFRVPRILP